MFKKNIILCVVAAVALFIAIPASAQNYGQTAQSQQIWSVGGGYWTLPNVDDNGGAIDSSGVYASVSLRSINYLLEFDYSIQDTGFYVLSADYLYPLSQDQNYFGGSAFIGAGYTYFAADDLENESGFNILVGSAFSENFQGTIRYDFLGSEQELITFGVQYSFY